MAYYLTENAYKSIQLTVLCGRRIRPPMSIWTVCTWLSFSGCPLSTKPALFLHWQAIFFHEPIFAILSYNNILTVSNSILHASIAPQGVIYIEDHSTMGVCTFMPSFTRSRVFYYFHLHRFFISQ